MTVGALGAESVKGMGAGAYLVTVLPSAASIGMIFVLFNANVYPWTTPPPGLARGYDSLVAAVERLGPAGSAVMVALIFLLAVLVRPLHVVGVQLLEGYWSSRPAFGLLEAVAVERHLRRHSRAQARAAQEDDPAEWPQADFRTMVAVSRQKRREQRRKQHAGEVVADYPNDERNILPTRLGNVLRHAETSAGERYHLDTVTTFPRLYPFLHPRLHAELVTQFNLLDTAAAFTIVFWSLTVISAPVLFTGGWWILLPVSLLAAGAFSYVGALATARQHGTLLATAYDLHRFEMLRSLHLALPETPAEERTTNERLTNFLQHGEPDLPEPDYGAYGTIAIEYKHPEPDAPAAPESTGGS